MLCVCAHVYQQSCLNYVCLYCFTLTRFSVHLIDYKSQLEEDEQLARAIEESLNLGSPPRYGNGNDNMYQPIQYFPMGYRYGLEDGRYQSASYSTLFCLTTSTGMLRVSTKLVYAVCTTIHVMWT